MILQLAMAFLITASWAKGPIGESIDRATGVSSRGFGAGYFQKQIQQVQTRTEDKLYDMGEKQLDLVVPAGQKWVLHPKAKLKEIQSTAKIPGTNRPIPSSLWDGRMTVDYKSEVAGTTGYGMVLTGGSASDEPFRSFDEMFYDAFVYLSFGVEPRSTTLLFFNIGDLRPILNNFPVPGFSYGFRLSPRWGLSLGFPHFGFWAEPFDWLKVNISTEPITRVDARLLFDFWTFFKIFAEAQFDHQVYKRSRRVFRNERLVFNEYELNAGILQQLGPLLFEFAGGYSFGRAVLETRDYFDDLRNQRALELANGFLTQFNIRFAF